MSSLGILGGSGNNKMARPLDYQAAAGMRGLRGLRGLGHFDLRGALGGSTLPGNCWDVPGFKDCHAQAFAQAQRECGAGMADESYGGNMGECIERNADAYAWAGCVNKYCKPSLTPKISGPQPITFRNTTFNATVAKLQSALNPLLKKNGANQIAVDGKLGPGTCGAAYWIDGAEGTSYYNDYGLPQICKAMTMPTKAGTTTPVTTIAVAPQTTVTPGGAFTEKAGLPWDVFDADTAEVQKRLNVQLDASDMNPLNTGGVLNAPTCGAMKWAKETQGIDLLSIQGQNCQGFQAPTKRIKPSLPEAPAPTGPSSPTGPLPPAPGISAASMATTGLVLGALTLGGYYLGKKQGWF